MELLHLVIGVTALILHLGLLPVKNLVELPAFLSFFLVLSHSGLNLVYKAEQGSRLHFLLVEFSFEVRFRFLGSFS